MPGLLIWIIFVLVIVGLALWIIEQIPMNAQIKQILRVVVVVFVCLWLLWILAGFLPSSGFFYPSQRGR